MRVDYSKTWEELTGDRSTLWLDYIKPSKVEALYNFNGFDVLPVHLQVSERETITKYEWNKRHKLFKRGKLEAYLALQDLRQ